MLDTALETKPGVNAEFIFNDKDRVGRWVAEKVGQQSSWGGFYAMGVELSGKIVSGIVINGITDSNASCHIAVTKPTKKLPELIWHAQAYSFGQLGLRRLTAFIEDHNVASLRINSKIGFEDEFVMKSAGTGGCDVIVRVLWPQNFKLRF